MNKLHPEPSSQEGSHHNEQTRAHQESHHNEQTHVHQESHHNEQTNVNQESENHHNHQSFVDLGRPVAVRLNEGRACGFLGHAGRNPLSGKPILRDVLIASNFCVLDLWERHALYGKPAELARDPYVFKIAPLPLRTWLYHQYFNDDELMSSGGHSDHGIMERVLAEKVVDCDRTAGRWSPALCCAPAAFVSIFTTDLAAAWLLCFMCVFNVTASRLANTPQWFRHCRLITLIPRIISYVIVVWRMTECMDKGAFVILCFVVIVALLTLDFIAGDGLLIFDWGSRCHYQVIKALPQRVFICRKCGASFVPDPNAGRSIHQAITGIGYFDEMTIIAEVRGVVVQLTPMDKQDWKYAWEDFAETGRPISFIGLDIFNKTRRTADAIEREEEELAASTKEALLAEQATHNPEPDLLE